MVLTFSIKNIFEHNIELLGETDKAIYYFREQKYEKALTIVANSMDGIKAVVEAIIEDHEYFNLVETESLLDMLAGILNAKMNKDFILLADLLELQLVTLLIGVQELIISKEEIAFDEENYKDNLQLLMSRGVGMEECFKDPINTESLLEQGYRVEFTSGGRMTLAAHNNDATFYFHTNSLVQSEAFTLARHWTKANKKKYIIYGYGMGYHVLELLDIDAECEVEVYEADRNVLQLACAFAGVNRRIVNNKRAKVIYDPTYSGLKERIEKIAEDEVFLLHYPSYMNIRDAEIKPLFHSQMGWLEAMESI